MRVLIVRLSALGDVVQSLGAVRALAAARPELELGFAVQRPFAPLLDGLQLEVIPHDRGGGLAGVRRTARALRTRRYDVALDLQGNWKAAVIARLSGARRRLGIAGRWRREPASAVLLTERVDAEHAGHPARAALAVVRALAPGAEDLSPRLDAREGEIAAEAEALERLGVDPHRPFRVFVVAAQDDPRSWPVRAIEREAAARAEPALWLVGPGEAAAAVPRGALCLRHPAGSVRRLVALGALCARAGGEVLGPDRGATHVLAAAGARSTVLFGPQDPARTAPPGAQVLVRAGGPDCVPCRARRCAHPEGPVCMDFTTAEGRQPAPR